MDLLLVHRYTIAPPKKPFQYEVVFFSLIKMSFTPSFSEVMFSSYTDHINRESKMAIAQWVDRNEVG